MFFEIFILQKKGPLGIVWLASHYEKRLSKANVLETDLRRCTLQITSPKAQFACRLQGHLLLGCCRIYRRKVELLYADATDAVVKVRSAFRPGIIDLEKTTVNSSSITLPEVFEGLEFELPQLDSVDLPTMEDGLITFNIAHVKDITFTNEIDIMRHTQGSASFDLLSPGDNNKFVADQDMLNPEVTSQFELLQGDMEMLGGLDFLPEGQLPGYEDQLLNASWEGKFPPLLDSSPPPVSAQQKSVRVILLDEWETPRRKGQEQKKSLVVRRIRSVYDRQTQLGTGLMKKTIDDPTTLLRPLHRALPTRALIEMTQRYQPLSRVFAVPSAANYPKCHIDIFRRATDQLGSLPPTTENLSLPSIEEERNKSHDKLDFDGWRPNDDDYLDYRGEPVREGVTHEDGPFDVPLNADRDKDTPDNVDEEEQIPPNVADVDFAVHVTKRTKAMHVFLDKRFATDGEVLFFETLMKEKSRRSVSIAFLELLVLKSRAVIDVSQRKSYSKIAITKLDSFASVLH